MVILLPATPASLREAPPSRGWHVAYNNITI